MLTIKRVIFENRSSSVIGYGVVNQLYYRNIPRTKVIFHPPAEMCSQLNNSLILSIVDFKIIVIDKFALRKAKRNISKHLKYILKYLPNFVQDWNLKKRPLNDGQLDVTDVKVMVDSGDQKWRIELKRIMWNVTNYPTWQKIGNQGLISFT
jgi:hypothetical protein